MTAGSPAARALAAAPRWAGRLLAVLVAYAVGAQIALGWGIPEIAARTAGTALGLAASALLLASAAAALADPAPPLRERLSLALLRCGAGLLLLGLPASVLWRTTEHLQVAEGQELEAGALPGLPRLRIGAVRLAPKGEIPLLSKAVTVEAHSGGSALEIKLWPPALVSGWRLAVQRFGYAPEVQWRDGRGTPLADGWALIGTFPRSDADAALVRWTPPPNLMMGVGLYPPDLEDLLTPPGSPYHLFLRLDEATLAGARRNLRDPEAHRWLADGRPESPVWFVQVFRGREKLFEGQLPAGGEARFAGGAIRLGPDLALWAEVQAVRDPWLWVAVAGAIAALAGGVLVAAGMLRRRGWW